MLMLHVNKSPGANLLAALPRHGGKLVPGAQCSCMLH